MERKILMTNKKSYKKRQKHPKIDHSSRELFKDNHEVHTEIINGKPHKTWICKICNKSFKYQYTLVRHMPTHTDIRNYKCDECPKSFRQLSTLAQHKATHSNARPYSCEECGKSFNRISTLISHKRIHDVDKDYKCHICGRGFHQKGNLSSHMFIHTDLRPFKCEICQRGFNQKSNLVCHQASVHGTKQGFPCSQCSYSFARQNSLTKHIKNVHEHPVQTKTILKKRPPLPTLTSLPVSGTVHIQQKVRQKKVITILAKPHPIEFSPVEIREKGAAWCMIVRRRPTPLMIREFEAGHTLFVQLKENETDRLCKVNMGCTNFILTRVTRFDLPGIGPNTDFQVPVVLDVTLTYVGANKFSTKVVELAELRTVSFHVEVTPEEEQQSGEPFGNNNIGSQDVPSTPNLSRSEPGVPSMAWCPEIKEEVCEEPDGNNSPRYEENENFYGNFEESENLYIANESQNFNSQSDLHDLAQNPSALYVTENAAALPSFTMLQCEEESEYNLSYDSFSVEDIVRKERFSQESHYSFS